MNPGRFYLPRMGMNVGPMIGTSYLPTRGGFGLFSRIANSFRGFNWSGLLNGANKTLNVVNQTIPLVRQAGPMFNNMKSMLKIARAFGTETKNEYSKSNVNKKTLNNNIKDVKIDSNLENNNTKEKEVLSDNYPNFFV